MMRSLEIKKILLILILMFSFNLVVEAACSTKDLARLNGYAAKIETKYEIVDEEVKTLFSDPETDEEYWEMVQTHSIDIKVYNIHPEIYVVQTNKNTGEETTIHEGMTTDGVYTFNVKDVENIVSYNYEIFSNVSKDCIGDTLKTYNFVKPKRNFFANYELCEGNESIEICKPYVTKDLDVDPGNLAEEIAKYDGAKVYDSDNEKSETVSNFKELTEGKSLVVLIIGGVVGVAIIGTVVYLIIKRKRDII